METRNWTREETIVAFNVYCKIPFAASNKNHPLIKQVAAALGRTPSALNMKVGNIGRLDPGLHGKGISGLAHGAKMDERVWAEFHDHPELLAVESEKILAQLQGRNVLEEDVVLPPGVERETLVRRRLGQDFFRGAVIGAYSEKCCISGVTEPHLLQACHIVGWAEDEKERTNPKNGLCMNVFFHQAYDQYLVGVTPDMTLVVSQRLIDSSSKDDFRDYLSSLDGKSIIRPVRFMPDPDLLAMHYDAYKQHN